MSDSLPYLFVYGTLLAEAQHPMGALLQQHADLIGEGTIQARLYIIEEIDKDGPNSYPGAVPSPHADDRVYGRVFRVNEPETVFPAFDNFEACTPGWPEPYEFLLRPIDVTLSDGRLIRTKSYLYTWDTSRATLVPSGRFNRRATDAR